MVVKSYGVCNGVQQESLLDVTNMVVYLDESGGEHTRDWRLRRAGWGLALLPVSTGDPVGDTSFLGGWSGDLEGQVQTQNRACLTACRYALEHTKGPILIKPDASYLSGGFDKLRHFFPVGEHADLWHEIGKLVKARREWEHSATCQNTGSLERTECAGRSGPVG